MAATKPVASSITNSIVNSIANSTAFSLSKQAGALDQREPSANSFVLVAEDKSEHLVASVDLSAKLKQLSDSGAEKRLQIPFAADIVRILAAVISSASVENLWHVAKSFLATSPPSELQAAAEFLELEDGAKKLLAALPHRVQIKGKCVSVSCGAEHVMLLREDGQVFGSGANEQGQLGLGDTESRLSPCQLQGIPVIAAVSCGRQHTALLTRSGELVGCGCNANDQFGRAKDEKPDVLPVSMCPRATISQFRCTGDGTVAMCTERLLNKDELPNCQPVRAREEAAEFTLAIPRGNFVTLKRQDQPAAAIEVVPPLIFSALKCSNRLIVSEDGTTISKAMGDNNSWCGGVCDMGFEDTSEGSLHHFEFKLVGNNEGTKNIMLGIAASGTMSFDNGMYSNGTGCMYHSRNGQLHSSVVGQNKGGNAYGQVLGHGDTLSCTLEYVADDLGTLSFAKNGESFGPAYTNLHGKWAPAVDLHGNTAIAISRGEDAGEPPQKSTVDVSPDKRQPHNAIFAHFSLKSDIEDPGKRHGEILGWDPITGQRVMSFACCADPRLDSFWTFSSQAPDRIFRHHPFVSTETGSSQSTPLALKGRPGADMFAGNLVGRNFLKALEDVPKWLLSCIDVLAGSESASDLPADELGSEPTEEPSDAHEMVEFGVGGYTQCTTCNMMGPSRHSGPTYCVNCHLCAKCIERRGAVCALAKKDIPKKTKVPVGRHIECEGQAMLQSCFWSLTDSNADQSLLDLLAMSWNLVKVQSTSLQVVRVDNLAVAIISVRMTYQLFLQKSEDSDGPHLGSTRWKYFGILREMACADVSGSGSERAIGDDLTALALEAWLYMLQNFFVAAADQCAIICQLLCFIVDRPNQILMGQSNAANNVVTKTIEWLLKLLNTAKINSTAIFPFFVDDLSLAKSVGSAKLGLEASSFDELMKLDFIMDVLLNTACRSPDLDEPEPEEPAPEIPIEVHIVPDYGIQRLSMKLFLALMLNLSVQAARQQIFPTGTVSAGAAQEAMEISPRVMAGTDTSRANKSLQSFFCRCLDRCIEAANSLLSAARDAAGVSTAPMLRELPLLAEIVFRYYTKLEAKSFSQKLDTVLIAIGSLRDRIAISDGISDSVETSFCEATMESAHPYAEAQVTLNQVEFGDSVAWVKVIFDPLTKFAQPEDRLIVSSDTGSVVAILTKDTVLPELVVPGNRLQFEFQTATDYIKDKDAAVRFGYTASVFGYTGSLVSECAEHILSSIEACFVNLICGCAFSLVNTPANYDIFTKHDILKQGLLRLPDSFVATDSATFIDSPSQYGNQFLCDFAFPNTSSASVSESLGNRLGRWFEQLHEANLDPAATVVTPTTEMKQMKVGIKTVLLRLTTQSNVGKTVHSPDTIVACNITAPSEMPPHVCTGAVRSLGTGVYEVVWTPTAAGEWAVSCTIDGESSGCPPLSIDVQPADDTDGSSTSATTAAAAGTAGTFTLAGAKAAAGAGLFGAATSSSSLQPGGLGLAGGGFAGGILGKAAATGGAFVGAATGTAFGKTGAKSGGFGGGFGAAAASDGGFGTSAAGGFAAKSAAKPASGATVAAFGVRFAAQQCALCAGRNNLRKLGSKDLLVRAGRLGITVGGHQADTLKGLANGGANRQVCRDCTDSTRDEAKAKLAVGGFGGAKPAGGFGAAGGFGSAKAASAGFDAGAGAAHKPAGFGAMKPGGFGGGFGAAAASGGGFGARAAGFGAAKPAGRFGAAVGFGAPTAGAFGGGLGGAFGGGAKSAVPDRSIFNLAVQTACCEIVSLVATKLAQGINSQDEFGWTVLHHLLVLRTNFHGEDTTQLVQALLCDDRIMSTIDLSVQSSRKVRVGSHRSIGAGIARPIAMTLGKAGVALLSESNLAAAGPVSSSLRLQEYTFEEGTTVADIARAVAAACPSVYADGSSSLLWHSEIVPLMIAGGKVEPDAKSDAEPIPAVAGVDAGLQYSSDDEYGECVGGPVTVTIAEPGKVGIVFAKFVEVDGPVVAKVGPGLVASHHAGVIKPGMTLLAVGKSESAMKLTAGMSLSGILQLIKLIGRPIKLTLKFSPEWVAEDADAAPEPEPEAMVSKLLPIISATQLRMLKACFAATIWQCDAVGDAIACATFLKFQDIGAEASLPKALQGLVELWTALSLELTAPQSADKNVLLGRLTERARALLMVGQTQMGALPPARDSSDLARSGSVREIKTEPGHRSLSIRGRSNHSQLKEISEDDEGMSVVRSLPLEGTEDESGDGSAGLFRVASARVPTLSSAAVPKPAGSASLISRTQSTAYPSSGGLQRPASDGASEGFALVNTQSPALAALVSSCGQRGAGTSAFSVVIDYLESESAISARDLLQLGGESIRILKQRMDGLSLLRQILERVSSASQARTFDVIWVVASLVNSSTLKDAHIMSGLWLPATESSRLKTAFFDLLSSISAEMERSIIRLAGPGAKPAVVLPYDGNIQKAMQAQDRDAIRTIMTAKNQEPEPEASADPAAIESNLQLVRMCLRCFGLTFQPADFEWVHESRLLTLLGQVERCSLADKGATTLSGVSARQLVAMDSEAFELKATSNEGMLASLIDKKTDSFWEPGGNEHGSATVRVVFKEPVVLDQFLIRVHIDNTRDGGEKQVTKVAVSFIGIDGKALPKLPGLSESVRVNTQFAGWVQCSTAAAGERRRSQVQEVKLVFDPQPGNRGVRVRGLRLLHSGGNPRAELPSVQQSKADAEAMEIFRTLAARCVPHPAHLLIGIPRSSS
jgi:hypothetical protein